MSELSFKGKEFVYNHHLSVPFRPLIPHPQKGIGTPSLDGNLIVHGDNLHALKALLPLYAGKVDCVFIDPPYNTGNENWCYNDNVNAPMIKEWLDANPVGVEDGLRHDKWCAMMWPRSLRRRTFAARNWSPVRALSSVSGRFRRSAGRGGFSVVGEPPAEFGLHRPYGPPETAVRVDLSPLRAS